MAHLLHHFRQQEMTEAQAFFAETRPFRLSSTVTALVFAMNLVSALATLASAS